MIDSANDKLDRSIRMVREEEAYQEHISNEGGGVANEHPDGCFYCGSGLHHSQDCHEATR